MEIRKSITPLPGKLSNHNSLSSQFTYMLSPNSIKMRQEICLKTKKAETSRKNYTQWRTSIQKIPKSEEPDDAVRMRSINAHVFTKARLKNAMGSMELLIADKQNEIKSKITNLEKMKHDFANLKCIAALENTTTVLFRADSLEEQMKKRLNDVKLFDAEEQLDESTIEDVKTIFGVSNEKSLRSSVNMPSRKSESSSHGQLVKCINKASSKSEISVICHRPSSNSAIGKMGCSSVNNNEEEVLKILGKDKLNQLRYIFEKYCSKSNPTNVHMMESQYYHKFLADNGMLGVSCTQVNADLLFCKGNKSKSINFSKFCSILIDLAISKYPEISSKTTAVESFVRETIFHVRNLNAIEKSDKYEDWFLELESAEVVKYLASHKTPLTNIFKKHSFSSGKITLKEFIKLCQEKKIIPDLLSNQDCSQMFKVCQSTYVPGKDVSSLGYDEYIECLCFLGFYYYTKVASKEALTYPEKVRKFMHSIIR